MSESPPATRESAGEGVAVTGVRVSCGRLGHTTTTHVRERIGWGGCGGNRCPGTAESCLLRGYRRMRIREGVTKWCPGVVRSCSSRFSQPCSRTESVGEDVAETCVRLLCGRIHHNVSHLHTAHTYRSGWIGASNPPRMSGFATCRRALGGTSYQPRSSSRSSGTVTFPGAVVAHARQR